MRGDMYSTLHNDIKTVICTNYGRQIVNCKLYKLRCAALERSEVSPESIHGGSDRGDAICDVIVMAIAMHRIPGYVYSISDTSSVFPIRL